MHRGGHVTWNEEKLASQKVKVAVFRTHLRHAKHPFQLAGRPLPKPAISMSSLQSPVILRDLVGRGGLPEHFEAILRLTQ